MCEYNLPLTKTETCYIVALLNSTNYQFVDYKSWGEGQKRYMDGEVPTWEMFLTLFWKNYCKNICLFWKNQCKMSLFSLPREPLRQIWPVLENHRLLRYLF